VNLTLICPMCFKESARCQCGAPREDHMDTPSDLAKHTISFRVSKSLAADGYNAWCTTCGALFRHADDEDQPCAPQAEKEDPTCPF
jgi:hypothetical protein